MGYRSEVAYTIRFVCNQINATDEDRVKCKESFYTFLAEAKAKPETALCFSEEQPINKQESNGEGFFVDEENLSIKFFAYHVKWYPDYSDVKCHEALMQLSKNWEDDNDYVGGAYARVGEDSEDIDEDWWGTGDSEWLYVTRAIAGDWL